MSRTPRIEARGPSNLHPYVPKAVRSATLVASYPPRQCGIATFTADLVAALTAVSAETRLTAVAINDMPEGYAYPQEVGFEISQHVLGDYKLAAEYINMSRTSVVCLQHEFGLFGGDDGSHILNMLSRLRMPAVVVLHTVLKDPSKSQRAVLCELARLTDRLIVMSDVGRSLLKDVYDVREDQIATIPHGIPDTAFVDSSYYKEQFGVDSKKVLLTFGLLSPNKGIEHMLRALPAIVERHPDVVYAVVGATHPHLKRSRGEAYRLSLHRIARDMGVEEHVVFHNRFVDIRELCEFLGSADVYVTPYLNEAQAVSGTLAYAMGTGKAVVSTPYWHATEMLAEGRGVIVPFGASDELAAAVNHLFDDDHARNAMRKRAYDYSRASVWTEVARSYLRVFDGVCSERRRRPRRAFSSALGHPPTSVPEPSLSHLDALTDDTGILQHAKFTVPARQHGYCTDDNARAVIVTARLRPYVRQRAHLDQLAVRYLAFLAHAFDDETRVFRNFMGYDRSWLEKEGSPDCQGRAVWALGVAATRGTDSQQLLAAELFRAALDKAEDVSDLRTVSFVLMGIAEYLERFAGDTAVQRLRTSLVERLAGAFHDSAAADEWPFPYDKLTYANAALPHALLIAGRTTDQAVLVEMGLRTLTWLLSLQTEAGRFSPVGNSGFYPRHGTKARFDQQPIEADTTLAACAEAFRVTGDQIWLDQATRCFHWYLGQNDLGVSLYDPATGGCCDGLSSTGASENQGAESTLAWLHALAEMHKLHLQGVLALTGSVARELNPNAAVAEAE